MYKYSMGLLVLWSKAWRGMAWCYWNFGPGRGKWQMESVLSLRRDVLHFTQHRAFIRSD
jgi:hypothetical protein